MLDPLRLPRGFAARALVTGQAETGLAAILIMHVHSLLYECIGLEDSNELCDYLLENLKGPTKGSPRLENRFEAVKFYLPSQPSIHRCECDFC